MEYQHIRLDIADGVARITLNRPERLNAFVPGMPLEIKTAIEQAGADGSARAIAITGEGRGFCAGADLTAGTAATPPEERDAGALLETEYNPMILAMQDCAKPIVAIVNGPCAGAGMSLALACDIIVAAESAIFLQAFCNIGLVPDAGSTWYLPRKIGSARAAGMALLGEKLSATEAAEWGLIWKAVPDADLGAESEKIVQRLAQGPTRGLGMIRQALNQSADNALDTQLGLERDSQRIAGQTGDFMEGVVAFMQKRPANFTGS
jgi:2-(1,2-epoxy-1,2-dihydrophenyl)acetyl-CoA isomerase